MIGWTLSTYIARKYTMTVVSMMVSLLLLIVLIDFINHRVRDGVPAPLLVAPGKAFWINGRQVKT